MTIAPIVRTVRVRTPPARTFELFTTRVGAWWPKGRTIAPNPHEDIVIEPFAGGRWFERDAGGAETDWGKVLAWEPPRRLLLAWQINTGWRFDPDLLTEVELTFEPDGAGTLVTLTHSRLERFGATAATHAGLLGGGWPGYLTAFATFTETLD